MVKTNSTHFGALCLENEGVSYRTWAPSRQELRIVIQNQQGQEIRSCPMQKDNDGFHVVTDPQGKAGDLYRIKIGKDDLIPDPSSHFQPLGIDGPSQVVNHQTYSWKTKNNSSISMRDLVIYELHIGTFTREGTYKAAIDKLPHLKELGVTAIEIMPIADFSGRWNWGYDGVMLFAPARCYGEPDDLKKLIDAAHGLGLHAILDVVYNHFGPMGNYWHVLAPEFFNESKQTVWGAAISYDIKKTKPVRDLYLENIRYWRENFRFDGLRLDATHAIYDESDPHIFAELTKKAHEMDLILIAEDERNERLLLLEPAQKGYGFNAVWADDFHHAVRVHLTQEDLGCLKDFKGSAQEIIQIINTGWLYTGQNSTHLKVCRGTSCQDLHSSQFIWCVSNHDQVGNRPLGEALHQYIPQENFAAAVGLLCFSPYTPMLFMGQEWATQSPFLYFTDYVGELGRLVSEGRKKDFKDFYEGCQPTKVDAIPDPQDEKTFYDSKLDWELLSVPKHQHIFQVHQKFLSHRKQWLTPSLRERNQWEATALNEMIRIQYQGDDHDLIVISGLRPKTLSKTNIFQNLKWPKPHLKWRILLSSNFFSEKEPNRIDLATGDLDLKRPETLVLIGEKMAHGN